MDGCYRCHGYGCDDCNGEFWHLHHPIKSNEEELNEHRKIKAITNEKMRLTKLRKIK